jgi:hypothetical protein
MAYAAKRSIPFRGRLLLVLVSVPPQLVDQPGGIDRDPSIVASNTQPPG